MPVLWQHSPGAIVVSIITILLHDCLFIKMILMPFAFSNIAQVPHCHHHDHVSIFHCVANHCMLLSFTVMFTHHCYVILLPCTYYVILQ